MQDSDNLLKIRELLFGSSLKELDERFVGLETSIKENLQVQHNELHEQLSDIARQLVEETGQRKIVADELKQEIDKLQARLDHQQSEMVRALEDLSKRLGDQQAAFKTALDEKIESIQSQMLQQLDLLKQTKLERGSFATMLSNMAGQLSAQGLEDSPDSPQNKGEA